MKRTRCQPRDNERFGGFQPDRGRVPCGESPDTGHEEAGAGLNRLHVVLRRLRNGGMPGVGAYAACKAGLIGLAQSLASDHAAEGIRVNALLPGGTITASGGEGNPAALEFIANLHPMKRMGSFMTGSPMTVDGGMSVRLT